MLVQTEKLKMTMSSHHMLLLKHDQTKTLKISAKKGKPISSPSFERKRIWWETWNEKSFICQIKNLVFTCMSSASLCNKRIHVLRLQNGDSNWFSESASLSKYSCNRYCHEWLIEWNINERTWCFFFFTYSCKMKESSRVQQSSSQEVSLSWTELLDMNVIDFRKQNQTRQTWKTCRPRQI